MLEIKERKKERKVERKIERKKEKIQIDKNRIKYTDYKKQK